MFIELLQKAALSAAVKALIAILPPFRTTDPQQIKLRYFVHIIDKLEKRLNGGSPGTEDPSRTKLSTIATNKWLHYGQWYEWLARVNWGRPSARDRFKSSWLYITAAMCFEKAGASKQASDNYHFGANGLREVESFRASIDYYIKASETALTPQWKRRGLLRALGVARTAGDLDEEQRILSKL